MGIKELYNKDGITTTNNNELIEIINTHLTETSNNSNDAADISDDIKKLAQAK